MFPWQMNMIRIIRGGLQSENGVKIVAEHPNQVVHIPHGLIRKDPGAARIFRPMTVGAADPVKMEFFGPHFRYIVSAVVARMGVVHLNSEEIGRIGNGHFVAEGVCLIKQEVPSPCQFSERMGVHGKNPIMIFGDLPRHPVHQIVVLVVQKPDFISAEDQKSGLAPEFGSLFELLMIEIGKIGSTRIRQSFRRIRIEVVGPTATIL